MINPEIKDQVFADIFMDGINKDLITAWLGVSQGMEYVITWSGKKNGVNCYWANKGLIKTNG